MTVKTFLRVPDVAERLGINSDKVRGWIATGELRAVNVAAKRGGRPRWRIDPADLEMFLAARQAETAAPRRLRRRRRQADVINFF